MQWNGIGDALGGNRERSSAADHVKSTLDWLSSVHSATGGKGERNTTTSSEYTHE